MELVVMNCDGNIASSAASYLGSNDASFDGYNLLEKLCRKSDIFSFKVLWGSFMAKLTKANQSLSPAAEKALFQLGSRVRRARIARRWTLADLSERMFVTPATVRRLELGHPGTSLGVLVTALSIFGLTSDLDRLAALDSDRIASMRAEEYQPKRVRTRNPTVSLDF